MLDLLAAGWTLGRKRRSDRSSRDLGSVGLPCYGARVKWIRAWRARRAVERDEWRRLALAFEMNCTDPVIRERAEREWAKLLP